MPQEAHGRYSREANGRRVFSTEFKRTQIQRVLTGEKTPAEWSWELDPSAARVTRGSAS